MNNRNIPNKKELTTLYKLGYSMKEIGQQLNMSVGKVHKYFHIFGIVPREKLSKNNFAKKKISERAKLRPSPSLGKKLSNETKEKLSIIKSNGIGKKEKHNGYIRIYFPDHPKSDKRGWISEHDLIMECYIGRWLKKDEVVHHKNEIKIDNRIENLQLMKRKEHSKYHRLKKIRKEKERNDDLSTN